VAQFDALLQVPLLHPPLMRHVIEALAAATSQRHAEQWALTASSRVRFFTMQPEAAA